MSKRLINPFNNGFTVTANKAFSKASTCIVNHAFMNNCYPNAALFNLFLNAC